MRPLRPPPEASLAPPARVGAWSLVARQDHRDWDEQDEQACQEEGGEDAVDGSGSDNLGPADERGGECDHDVVEQREPGVARRFGLAGCADDVVDRGG